MSAIVVSRLFLAGLKENFRRKFQLKKLDGKLESWEDDCMTKKVDFKKHIEWSQELCRSSTIRPEQLWAKKNFAFQSAASLSPSIETLL